MISNDPYISAIFCSHPRATNKASKVVAEFKEKRQQLYEILIAAGVDPLEAWDELGLETLCKKYSMKNGEIEVSTNQKGTMSIKFNIKDIKLIGLTIIDFLTNPFGSKKSAPEVQTETRPDEDSSKVIMFEEKEKVEEVESIKVIIPAPLTDKLDNIVEEEAPAIAKPVKPKNLSAADIKKIKTDYTKGLTVKEICKLYNVSKYTVNKIVDKI